MKSQLQQRAEAVFPGKKWTRGPLGEPWSLSDPRFPKFMTRGKGCRVVDDQHRTFIDYHCSFGATLLGYGEPRVEQAAWEAAQATGGPLLPGPTEYGVQLAETLVNMRPGATWAILAKNGTDVTTLARVAARACTGKQYILREKGKGKYGVPAYHGASPQWLGGRPGILPDESNQYELHYEYNNLQSVKEAILSVHGNVAAIFVGACSYPYSSPTVEPTRAFVQGLRALADDCQCMLVLDEIRTNLRVTVNNDAAEALQHGSWHQTGGTLCKPPDMYCLCKAIGNGHPISALLGTNGACRRGAEEMTATGTYWLGAPAMAAALTTLAIVEQENVMGKVLQMGNLLCTGLRELASKHGLQITVSGPVSMPFLTFDHERPFKRPMSELFCAEMAGLGVWLHPHHNWYLMASHERADIDETLKAADVAFLKVKVAMRNGGGLRLSKL